MILFENKMNLYNINASRTIKSCSYAWTNPLKIRQKRHIFRIIYENDFLAASCLLKYSFIMKYSKDFMIYQHST